MEFCCRAATKTADILYTVEICRTEAINCTKFMDKTKFDRMCLEGCPNYHHKWSCPPYSPDFERFASIWDNLYIVFMHTDLSQFSYIQNDYLKVKAANSILKSRADRYTRSMAKKHGNYISTGSCRLCKPCKCKIGELCAHPEIMTYSYEALGIDVGQLVEEYFHKPLMWYKRDCLPQYTSVVSGILTNEELDDEYLRYCYQMSIGIS